MGNERVAVIYNEALIEFRSLVLGTEVINVRDQGNRTKPNVFKADWLVGPPFSRAVPQLLLIPAGERALHLPYDPGWKWGELLSQNSLFSELGRSKNQLNWRLHPGKYNEGFFNHEKWSSFSEYLERMFLSCTKGMSLAMILWKEDLIFSQVSISEQPVQF